MSGRPCSMRPGLFPTRSISARDRMNDMAKQRLLANMNISPETVNALQEKGLDIIRVSQILPVTSSDAEILDLARRGVFAIASFRSILQKEFEVSGGHNPCSSKFPQLQKIRIPGDQIISLCSYGARKNMIVIRVPAYSGYRLGWLDKGRYCLGENLKNLPGFALGS
jgi:hypothetical protein